MQGVRARTPGFAGLCGTERRGKHGIAGPRGWAHTPAAGPALRPAALCEEAGALSGRPRCRPQQDRPPRSSLGLCVVSVSVVSVRGGRTSVKPAACFFTPGSAYQGLLFIFSSLDMAVFKLFFLLLGE